MTRSTRVSAWLALLPLAPLLGCGGGDTVTGGGGSTGSETTSVASVTVTPARDTAVSIGESVPFTAAARDAGGSAVSGVSFAWSSSDTAVAAVSATGRATAKANGTTRIVASAQGHADTAVLVVEQRTASVAVSPDTARLSAPGDTLRFGASARDANGHEVPGVGFAWGVSDTAVATIDGTGLLTARQIGVVTVTARASDVTGEAFLRITTSVPPGITSVSPSPLQEGAAATITGTDFDPLASGDTVLVDGVRAAVTSASATSLQITVPTFDCLPARSVTVRVATDGGSAQTAGDLEPDEAPVSVAPGRQTVITDPASFCLQFPATGASERYLVGVQSLATTASTLTPVTITAEAADGSGAADVAAAPLAAERRTVADGREVRIPAWRTGQREAESRLRTWEEEHLDPAAAIPARGGGAAGPPALLSVSGSAAVDDTVQLRVPDIGDPSGTNPCTTYADVTGVVEAVGTRAIVVADTANPANGFTRSDYQDLSDQLDAQIFATDVATFGDPGDIDSNGHIVVLFTKEVNSFTAGTPGAVLLGFVFSGDWFPRLSTTGSSCPASNEGEIYYGRVPDPAGTYGTSTTRTQELARAPSTMAHELVHLIQFGRRFALGLGFMGSPMAEAQAVLGEEAVGHDVTVRQPYQNYGFDVAFNTDGTDAIDWYASGVFDLFQYFGFENATTRVPDAPESCGWWQQDPSPCTSRSLWYGVGWSFLRWLSDTYGPAYPGGEKGLQQDLIADPGSGPSITADVVGVPLATLMARWAAALYVDDRIASPDPELTFTSWNLFDFEQNALATAHLVPAEEGFSDWTGTADVRASSAGYVAVDGVGRPATAIRIRGVSDGLLPGTMQVWVVRMR